MVLALRHIDQWNRIENPDTHLWPNDTLTRVLRLLSMGTHSLFIKWCWDLHVDIHLILASYTSLNTYKVYPYCIIYLILFSWISFIHKRIMYWYMVRHVWTLQTLYKVGEVRTRCIFTCKRMTVDPYPQPSAKMNSKGRKPKTMKLLEETAGEIPHELDLVMNS